nr:uncharacterized protein LOC126056788 [Helicoverpa armigera]
MVDVLKQNYDFLVEIRNYLVKKGQSRYRGNIISAKSEQAKSAFENCCKTFLLLEKSKDINLALAIDLYEKIKQKYEEIVKLCILPVTLDLGKMDFDLKVACSLIPVMDGVEATTKRLIDSVEMYAGMLDAPDGLRSSRLSTIISARGFNNLKDAIQAAKDEECTSFQASGNILYASKNGRCSYNVRRSQRSRYHRDTGRSQYSNSYPRGHQYSNNYNRGGFRGNFRTNYRSSFGYQRGNRGSRYVRTRGRGQNAFPVEQVHDTREGGKNNNNIGTSDQFFRP